MKTATESRDLSVRPEESLMGTLPNEWVRSHFAQCVMEWARTQIALPELSAGLLYGPGGDGPDLILFAHGCGLFVYFTTREANDLPEPVHCWVNRWAAAGAPRAATFATSSVFGACSLLVDHLQPHLLDIEGWAH